MIHSEPAESGSGKVIQTAVAYCLMVVVTAIAFLWIRGWGETLAAPPRELTAPSTATGAGDGSFLHVLVALTAIVVLGRVLAKLLAYLSQPPVIGEVAAGILLGPSLLGPDVSSFILPPSVAPYLGVIAQLGVVLYMFLVGLELNPALLRRRSHATILTSHTSILIPFLSGALLALFLYPRLSTSAVSFTSFALFMGVAMSITAFPVLARILTDCRMSRTPLGVVALSCAAIDDVTAWCLLALMVGVAKAQIGQGFLVVAGAIVFIAFMFLVARPLLQTATGRWSEKNDSLALETIVFVALLVSALAAEAIGIHAIFGAFLLGAVTPHNSEVARSLTRQLERFVTILLLPAFFALTGMRTRIDLLTDPNLWLICGLIIVVATVGKFGGTLAAARLTGSGWREASMLGVLMNTRGLMELIVLNVGLDLKIISPTVFSMMVLMALVTTALTSPLLQLLKIGMPTDQAVLLTEFPPDTGTDPERS